MSGSEMVEAIDRDLTAALTAEQQVRVLALHEARRALATSGPFTGSKVDSWTTGDLLVVADWILDLPNSATEQWSADDDRDGRKINYTVSSGVISTAYLTEHLAACFYSGTDKYTDAPVIVKWDGERYIEILAGPAPTTGEPDTP